MSEDTAMTPLAERIARQAGLAPETLTGLAGGGKIRAREVLARLGASGTALPVEPTVEPGRDGALTGAAPQYLGIDCSLVPVQAACAALGGLRGSEPLGPLPLVLAAVAAALRSIPSLNARWGPHGVQAVDAIDLLIVVLGPDGTRRCFLPAAGTLPLAAVAAACREAGEQPARAASDPPPTFTVYDARALGVEHAPSIAPPAVAALALAEPSAPKDSGGQRMACTLALDPRAAPAADAAAGAAFLRALRRLLEDPRRLLL